jgi:hypothetical protein
VKILFGDGIEPSLKVLVFDPIVHLLMRAGRVPVKEIVAMILALDPDKAPRQSSSAHRLYAAARRKRMTSATQRR